MTVVVSDTSPLNYLVQIGAVEIIPRLFSSILVPPSVVFELGQPGAPAHPHVEGNPKLHVIDNQNPCDPLPIHAHEKHGNHPDDPLVWHGRFQRTTLEALAACLDRIRSDGPLGALPTFWVHGEDDQLVPIDATREGIEALRGVVFEEKVYPGARHEIFNETNKDEVLADVTAFLGRSLGRSA
jgi:pimeloyl-ACP methyl ester carboxylesterase